MSSVESTELVTSKTLPESCKTALLGDYTSRANKMHLAIGWKRFRGYVEYRWTGRPLRSRMQFQFEPDGDWHTARSFDEDRLNTYQSNGAHLD